MPTGNSLADYRPVAKPSVHIHGLEEFADAKEFVAQARALRSDFLDREAKLRQASDMADAAASRADVVLYSLDEKKRSAERAAEAATHARAQAREVAALLEQSHAAIRDATRAAEGARGDAVDAQQQQHQLRAEVDAARFDLQAFLEDIRIGREELQSLQSLSRPFAPAAPGAVPGLAPGDAPGAFAAVPTMYPAGPTVLGFLYDLITNSVTGGVQKTGDTMTGALLVNITSGPAFEFSGTAMVRSGAFGLSIDKAKALTTNPHSLIFKVGGAPLFEWGVDFATNNSINGGTGGSYFAMLDHTAKGNLGADIWAISPAEQDSISSSVKATKWLYSGTGTGSAKDETHLATLTTGSVANGWAVDLGGLSMTINSLSARDHVTLVNAHATSKRNVINFGGFWKMGSDMAGAGTANFLLRDNTNSLNRVYIETTAALLAKMGVNTTAPLANLYSAVTADASLYDTPQTGLGVGYSSINNRTWQVQYITDATQVELINWLFGTLGSTSTRATPTATSATLATGIKCNQLGGDLISAASGTNTAIVSALNWASAAGAAKIGVLGTAAVVKQVGASAAGIASIADAPAKAAITALQNALAAFGWVTAPA